MSDDRWPWLDALRGLALGGIATVNLTWFSGYAVLDPTAAAAVPTAALDGSRSGCRWSWPAPPSS